MSKLERSGRAGAAPKDPAELEVEALLADLDHAREALAAAERRARTHLARRGVLDQTKGDLASMLREVLEEAPR